MSGEGTESMGVDMNAAKGGAGGSRFVGRRRLAAGVIAAAACLAVTIGAGSEARAQQRGMATIAAASDLGFALGEIMAAFRTDTGREVRATFGSSGNFATQIQQGAPFDLFLSADEGFVFDLADKGLTRDRGSLYAIGRIVIFAPKGSTLGVDANLDGLRRAIAAGQVKRFAIANPEHAPYGRAAEEALRAKGLWENVAPLLVLGENVQQAAQFATVGGSQGGIFALSLAIAPAFKDLGQWALIPDTTHEPLRQRMVLLRNAGDTATSFYQYLQQPAARAIMKRYGFALPGEALPGM